MEFLKLLFSFAPWLAFLIISGHSMFRLKLGIITAAVLVIVMGVTKLHRGIILWAGVLFFTYALVAVVLLSDMWAVAHMGVLANGALMLGTWISVLIKRPFTQDYAREHTDPAAWSSPIFMKTNYIITSAWGAVFTASVALAWFRMYHHEIPAWQFETFQYSLMLTAMLFTTWYPRQVREGIQAKLSAEGADRN